MGKKLLSAAKKGNLEEIKQLIENRVDINHQNYHGESALILASDNDHLNIVNYLIDMGANLNIKDNLEETALAKIIHNGVDWLHGSNKEKQILRLNLIQKMIDNKVNIGIIGPQNVTALHYAVIFFPEAIEILIKHGADLGAKTKHDGTPLDRAIYFHNFESVKTLLENAPDYYYAHSNDIILDWSQRNRYFVKLEEVKDRDKTDQLVSCFLRKKKFIELRLGVGGYFYILPSDIRMLIFEHLEIHR